MTEKDKVLAEKIKEIEENIKARGSKEYLITVSYLSYEGDETKCRTRMSYLGVEGKIYQMAMSAFKTLTESIDKD